MSSSLTPTSPTSSSLPSTQGNEIAQVRRSMSRGELVQSLSRKLTMNKFGFPSVIYRSDILPRPDEFYAFDTNTQNDYLMAAEMDVSYDEGFPTVSGGLPIWAMLPHESSEDYAMFEAYLTQNIPSVGDGGAEEALCTRNHYADKRSKTLIREVSTLATDLGVAQCRLSEIFGEYYWALRARAFDTYQVVAAEQGRARRMMAADNNVYLMSQKMMAKAVAYWDAFEMNEENIDAGTALKITESMVKLNRQALRMDVAGNSKGGRGPIGVTSTESLLKQVTHNDVTDTDDASDSNGSELARLLGNDEMAEMAQELIVKASRQESNDV